MRLKKGSMRLKKGSKVEVTRRREAPPGSWWCAEIISGNGHTYNVKYDCNEAVEREPRKAIRPCPPPVEGLRSWVPGDIVEVSQHGSWRLGEVSSRVVDGNYFVRLLGSYRPFRAHISDLRWRQSWEDNEWTVIERKLDRYNGTLPDGQKATPFVDHLGMDNQNQNHPRAAVGHHFIGSAEANDAESVGSSSPSHDQHGSHLYPANCASASHVLDGECGFAESCCSSTRELTLRSQKMHLKQKLIT